jgi:hypothetical protein
MRVGISSDRRLLLSYLFSNFAVLNGTLAPKLSLATEFLLRLVLSEFSTFELTFFGEDKRKNSSFEAVYPGLCVMRDSKGRKPYLIIKYAFVILYI